MDLTRADNALDYIRAQRAAVSASVDTAFKVVKEMVDAMDRDKLKHLAQASYRELPEPVRQALREHTAVKNTAKEDHESLAAAEAVLQADMASGAIRETSLGIVILETDVRVDADLAAGAASTAKTTKEEGSPEVEEIPDSGPALNFSDLFPET